MANRLREFEHVDRRPINYIVRRVDQMKRSQIIWGRGSPRKTISEIIKKVSKLVNWIEMWYSI